MLTSAAKMNKGASIKLYRSSISTIGDILSLVDTFLKQDNLNKALRLLNSVLGVIAGMKEFRYLEAVTRNKAGKILFYLKKFKISMAEFTAAREAWREEQDGMD